MRWTVRFGVLGAALVAVLATLVPAAQAVRPSKAFGNYPGGGTQAGDSLRVSVTLVANDDGTPLAGREVTYAVLDPAGTVLLQTSVVTDAAGKGSTYLTLDRPSGWYAARYSWPGDAEFGPTSEQMSFYASRREVEVGITGTFYVPRGDTVRLGAWVKDRWSFQRLANRQVRFQVAGFDAVATTDADGNAWVDVPVTAAPGEYGIYVTHLADAWYAQASRYQRFVVTWPYTFRDTAGAGVVRLDPGYREFRLELDGCTTAVKQDPYMTTADGRTTVAYRDVETTLSGAFDLDDRDFEAAASACGRLWSLKQVSV